MYMGEHTNVTEKLHEIQKQGRTKGSLWTTSRSP